MSVEGELREAISLRNEMAVDLAMSLLDLAVGYGTEPSRVSDRGVLGGRYAAWASDIEALTAVILQRAGVPWDAMAARADVSKQALHRRLSSRGESLFSWSLETSDFREHDVRILVQALRRAVRARGWDSKREALMSLPPHSHDLIWALAFMPNLDQIVGAPWLMSEKLVALRQTPGWWRSLF